MYTAFFHAVDQQGGIFRQRWGEQLGNWRFKTKNTAQSKLKHQSNHLPPLPALFLFSEAVSSPWPQNALRGHPCLQTWRSGGPNTRVVYVRLRVLYYSYEAWRSSVRRGSLELGPLLSFCAAGDAPIKTIGVMLSLRAEQLHRFSDIGYTHALL